MATISDVKTPVDLSPYGTTDYFIANTKTQQDYYPFGMLIPGRSFTNNASQTYKYGFNGKENDNEIKGIGNQQDYGMRIYDPRLGKFLSEDPITKKYPELTPYQFASNRPIQGTDLDGLEFKNANGTGSIESTTIADTTTLNAPNMGLNAQEIAFIQGLVTVGTIRVNGQNGIVPVYNPVSPTSNVNNTLGLYNSRFGTGSGNSDNCTLSNWQRGVGPAGNYLSPIVTNAANSGLLDKNGQMSIALHNYFVLNMITFAIDYTLTPQTAGLMQGLIDQQIQNDMANNNASANWQNIANHRTGMGFEKYRQGFDPAYAPGIYENEYLIKNDFEDQDKIAKNANKSSPSTLTTRTLIPYRDGPRGNRGKIKLAP